MSTRRSASLDGSLLARKGDATPAVPEDPSLAEGRTSPASDALSESRTGLAARLRPLTKSRSGLIALVSVALLAVVLVATEPWWGSADQMARVPDIPPASPVPVADMPVADLPSDSSAMPASRAPILPVVLDDSALTPPVAPAAEQARDEMIGTAVVSDAPPPVPATPPKKPAPPQARLATPPVTSGPYILQLAAFSNEKVARGEADRLQNSLTAVLGERRVVVVKAENAERQPVWRLRASAYATFADARAACDRIRKLKAGCWVIRR